MLLKKSWAFILTLISLIFLNSALHAESKIEIDIDFDGIPDRVYFEYLPQSKAVVTFKLSSHGFKRDESPYFTLISKHYPKYSGLSLDSINGLPQLTLKKHGAERIKSTFTYDPASKSVILVKLEHSLDGDNESDRAGISTLDLKSQRFIANWKPRELYWREKDSYYRTTLPTVDIKTNFSPVKLSNFNDQVITEFIELIKLRFEKAFYKEFPNGNSMYRGTLERDFNDDLGANKVYFDYSENRIAHHNSFTDEINTSLPIEIECYNFHIKESKTGFFVYTKLEKDNHACIVLSDNTEETSFQFRYDEWERSFDLIGISQTIIRENSNDLIKSSHNLITGKHVIDLFTEKGIKKNKSIIFKEKLVKDKIFLEKFDLSFYEKYMTFIINKTNNL